MNNTTPQSKRKLIAVALGREAADLAIINARLVNVFTAEIIPDSGLTVSGGRIAACGKTAAGAIGPQTRVIDAGGDYLVPGYVESHTHIANVFRLSDFSAAVLPRGTTTVVSETTELGNSLGLQGLEWLSQEAATLDLDLRLTAPCFSPPYPDYENCFPISSEEYEKVFQDRRFVGVGEAYWPDILAAGDRTLELLALAEAWKMPVQGHSAGAKPEQLNAFVAAGIASCHEPINAEQALDRLRLGLDVMVREGSIRRDLAGVAPVKELTRESRRISLSTDGVTPSWLRERGHLDGLGREAIELGYDPVTVLQMLTINAAEAFNLKDIGALAPGRRANFLLLGKLEEFTPRQVFINGRLRAENGKLKDEIKKTAYSYPEAARNSIRLKKISPADLEYRFTGNGPGRFRAIRPEIGSMVCFEEIVELRISDGCLQLDRQQDVCKYLVFDRYGSGRIARGLLAGCGIRHGAWASTLNWECYQPTLIGFDHDDMQLAFNRLLELGGGIVVARNRQILAELPLPIGGVMSELPMAEVLGLERGIVQALENLGSVLDNPFFHYQTLAFTGLPFLRLTDRGYFDVRKKVILPLAVSEET